MENDRSEIIGAFRKFYFSIVSSKIQLGAIFLSFAIAFFFLLWPKSKDIYSNVFDPFVSVLTFFTALLIGFFNIYSNWKNSLEKRLTVFFVYYYESLNSIDNLKNNKNSTLIELGKKFLTDKSLKSQTPYCLMICEEAFLAHEGDIRNWAQQLGRQLEGDNLSFHAFITLGKNDAIVKKSIDNKSFFTRQYTLFMFLDIIPNCVIENRDGILSTDNYDDKPTNTKLKINVVEINYKDILDYKNAKLFIDKVKSNLI